MKKILIFIFCLLFCTTTFAAPKEFVVIGDSLSDNGNLYSQLFQIVPKSPPYYQGRFTNGPTWAEYVGKYFYNKYFINYQVMAYGGATAILHNPAHDKFVAPITLDGEIFLYSTDSLFKDKSEILYAIWIGANDYLYDEQDDTNDLVNKVVNKISWAINSLTKQGARHFVVMNLPDLERTPFAREKGNGARLHALTVMHNQRLADAIKVLKKSHTDVNISMMNIYDIFNDLLDHPDKFNQNYHVNLTNLTDSCWTGGMTLQKDISKDSTIKNNLDKQALSNFILSSPSIATAYNVSKAYADGEKPCDKANEYVFWDHLHPTETVHGILAQIFVAEFDRD